MATAIAPERGARAAAGGARETVIPVAGAPAWLSGALAAASPVASAAVVPVFAVLAVVGLIPLFFYYRDLDRRSS